MIDAGAMNSLMSGSGPTVFGIFDQKETAMAALSKVRELEFVKHSYVVEPHQPK